MIFPTVVVLNFGMLAAIVLCLYRGLRSARREARGYAMSLQRLCSAPTLAFAASILGLLGPVDRPHNVTLWMLAFAVGLAVGAVRGAFVTIQVDREWHLLRIRRAEDGLLAMRLLALLGAFELLIICTRHSGSFWRPLLAACTAACAAFLVGRFFTVWYRARVECHIELAAAVPAAPELLMIEHGAPNWSSRTARLIPGYVPVIPPNWRTPDVCATDEAGKAMIAPPTPEMDTLAAARSTRAVRRDARGRFLSVSFVET